jgi:hypothetical protein
MPNMKNLQFKFPGFSAAIPILATLMEVFWIYCWMVWISRIPVLNWTGVPLNLLSCLFLSLILEITVRAAIASRWSLGRVRWTILPLGFILLALLIRLNLNGGFSFLDPGWFNYIIHHTSSLTTACIFGVIFIWRGISGGQADNVFSNLYRRFVFGIVGIILVLILWRIGGNPLGNIWSSLGLEIVLFFGCGLLAMAMANLEHLRKQLAHHEEATSGFSRRWTSILILLVVVILGLGIVLVSIFSADNSAAIAHFLGLLGNWILTGLIYLLYPVGFILQFLIWALRYILAALRGEPLPQDNPSDPGNPNDMYKNIVEKHLPAAVILVIKWVAIILVAALVIYLLSRLFNRYTKSKSDEGVEELNETLGSWQLFGKDLKGILAWLFSWLKPKKKPLAQPSEADQFALTDSDGIERVFTIREIYRALLWEGRQSGFPRHRNETPYEYCRRLQERKNELSSELNSLTQAYVSERYGQINPQLEQVNWLNRIWRTLKDKFHSQSSDY